VVGSNVTRSELTWELQQMKSQDILVWSRSAFTLPRAARRCPSQRAMGDKRHALIEGASKLGMSSGLLPLQVAVFIMYGTERQGGKRYGSVPKRLITGPQPDGQCRSPPE